ncbi:hypothetical protein SEA_LYELL_9 [Microbacterium phage Lyell]|nr:hypothetical protein SEA_LYELL_124 [Microbacterium phage Lyell]AXC36227.1 hypothetical protein SEA_LYELL_9 [Microbacterium phage Lyell]
MAIELQSLYACQTCYLIVAGFDPHELGLPLSECAPTFDGLSELEGNVVTGDPEEVRPFDTAPCDVCGSGLAGERSEVVNITGERDTPGMQAD